MWKVKILLDDDEIINKQFEDYAHAFEFVSQSQRNGFDDNKGDKYIYYPKSRIKLFEYKEI